MASPGLPSYYRASGLAEAPEFKLPPVKWPVPGAPVAPESHLPTPVEAPLVEATPVDATPAVETTSPSVMTPRTAPASSSWEAALADIAARAGIDHRYVESAIAATLGTAPKPAPPATPLWPPAAPAVPEAPAAPETSTAPETPTIPTMPAIPAVPAFTGFPEFPSVPPPAAPVAPAMPWTQLPDDLMAGVSTVYSAPGLGLPPAEQKLESPAVVPLPTSIVAPPEPVVPLPEPPSVDLPDLPRPAANVASPVISIGAPAADAVATVQFARPVFDKPVPQPAVSPQPVSKPETISKAEEDFFGPLPSEPSPSGEGAPPAPAVSDKVPEPKKRNKRLRTKDDTKAGDDKPAAAVGVVEADDGEPAKTDAGDSEKAADAEAAKDDDTESGGKPKKKPRKSRLPGPAQWAIEIAVWVVAALILSTLIRLFVVQLFVVPSGSMENTLEIGDRIAVLKYAQFQRGDIVVFSDPGGWLPGPAPTVSPVHEFFEKIGLLASTDQNYLVKRVIGLPGDEVKCCSNGHLTVNGVPIDESSYLDDPTQAASAFLFDVTVPAGRIFVLGDNRGDSADSRYHLCENDPQGLGMNAFVPIQNVVGPVRAVVLPFGRTGHRATPTSVFAKVPWGADPPPSVAKVSVSAGGYNGPCGNG